MSLFIDAIARNLRLPERGLFGSIVTNRLKRLNRFVEEKAAELCEIKPGFHVLEVGFGPGIGLKKAAQYIEKGEGKIHGIDLSPAMMCEAINNLPQEIADERVELTLGNVASLPYRDASMDCIFHTNCYFFWPDLATVARELYRVLKPGGYMVTLMEFDRVKDGEARGRMKYAKVDPEPYIEALRSVGFDESVRMETNREGEMKYESIIARKT